MNDDSFESPDSILYFGDILDRMCYPYDEYNILSTNYSIYENEYFADKGNEIDMRTIRNITIKDPMKRTASSTTAATTVTSDSSIYMADRRDDDVEIPNTSDSMNDNDSKGDANSTRVDPYTNDKDEEVPLNTYCTITPTNNESQSRRGSCANGNTHHNDNDSDGMFRLTLPDITQDEKTFRRQLEFQRNEIELLKHCNDEERRFIEEMVIERSNTIITESSTSSDLSTDNETTSNTTYQRLFCFWGWTPNHFPIIQYLVKE